MTRHQDDGYHDGYHDYATAGNATATAATATAATATAAAARESSKGSATREHDNANVVNRDWQAVDVGVGGVGGRSGGEFARSLFSLWTVSEPETPPIASAYRG